VGYGGFNSLLVDVWSNDRDEHSSNLHWVSLCHHPVLPIHPVPPTLCCPFRFYSSTCGFQNPTLWLLQLSRDPTPTLVCLLKTLLIFQHGVSVPSLKSFCIPRDGILSLLWEPQDYKFWCDDICNILWIWAIVFFYQMGHPLRSDLIHLYITHEKQETADQ
jgi:hypothetical protein